MGATGWLIRRFMRRRWVALSALALIVALGGTGAFVAAGAADRSASAYGRYLARADVSDVVINPSLFTSEIDRLIRDLPGVRSVTTDALLVASIDDGAPRTRAEFDAEPDALQVRGSADGRYSAMDRPVLDEGRLPTGPSEVLVSADLAAARGIAVGDVVPLSFWSGRDELLAEPDDVVSPVGVERVTVVGIATLADEVLPDDLYPRERMIVSPDMAARYDCLPDLPPYDATFEAAVAQAAPAGCATSYRYYALELEGGPGAVAATLDAFLRESAPLNPEVPPEMAAHGAGYYLVATTTADERDRVERSMQPTVTALGVLAAAAAAVTVAVSALAVARELRRSEDDQRTWWRLGLSARQRSVVLAAPMLVTVAAGLGVAVVLAWWLSPVAPVGSVRAVEPSPGHDLSGWVAVGGLGMAAACSAAVVVLTVRASHRAGRPVESERDGATGQSVLRRLAPVSARPAVDQGVRAAFGHSRGAGLVVASGALAVGTFVAALVFGSSLSAMLSTPAAYGWPWDLAAMTGSGYGDLDVEAVNTTLEGRADVASWSMLAITSDVTVNGRPVQAVVPLDLRPGIDFTVVEGRLPRDADEVALGARTAADLGVGIGDKADLDGPVVGPRQVTVAGIAVIPPVGQFQADRAAPGLGMVLSPSIAEPEEVVGNMTFVGIDLVPGADPRAVHTELRDAILSWDTLGYPPFEYRGPVRPAEIVNVRSMRAVPLVVGGLLAASAAVGLAVSVLVSVRARRRELGILRALGFTGRQVGNSVRVQVLATMLAALVIGVPLGLAAGRVVWRLFASQLGVATEPSLPGGWIAATVLVSLLMAIVVAALPARAAARIVPAAVLRQE